MNNNTEQLEYKNAKKIPFTNKLISIILGVFIVSTIFSLSVNYLDTFGIWVAVILSLGISIAGFYYTESNSNRRYVFWGTLATLIIGMTAFFISMNFLSDTLDKVV